MVNVPQRYVPRNLTKKDKKKQKRQLLKSRKNYKKGNYYTRKKVSSFKSKVSPHILKARKMYKVDNIIPSKALAKATKCSIKGLRRMVQKGQGAYFSSGSRPNQTGHSWGYARMASGITGGKASAVDYHILKDECQKNSKPLRLANKAMKKYNNGTRRVKKVKIGGGWSKKYKKSINCKKPKGFSQTQYCKYGRKKKKKKSTRKKKGGKPFCKMIQFDKNSPPYCSFVKSGMFDNKMNFKINGKDTDFIREINKEYMKWLKKALTMYEDYKSRPKKIHYISAANVLKDVEGFDDLSKKDKAYMIEIVATEIALYKLGFDFEDIDLSKIMKKKLKSKIKKKEKKKKVKN